jgi:integrase
MNPEPDMPSIKLTDRFIQSTKPEPGRRIDYFDQHVRGLMLRVSSDSKTFYFRYRSPNGGQPRFKLGTYPALSLVDAREQAILSAGALARGGDPARDRRRARAEFKTQTIRTVNDLADVYFLACETGEWAPKRKKKRVRVLEDERGVWRRHIKSTIGGLRLNDVTSVEVKALLRGMIARGIHAQTNRTHAVLRQMFNYAIATFDGSLMSVNPAHFPFLGTMTPRTRVLNDAEIAVLWDALSRPPEQSGSKKKYGHWPARPMRIVLQLCLVLMLRETEVVGMQVGELDLDQAVWKIPAHRMKGNREHLVPLSSLAVDLIREALALRRDPASPFVFPSPRHGGRNPMREDSVTHAMEEVIKVLGINPASPHDLRRTASTMATSERLGISPFIRSKLLAHSTASGGGAAVSSIHYDANEYVAEKRQALARWAELLLKIVANPPQAEAMAA